MRAAGLDFDEVDVWGKKATPEFLAKNPADLTPLLEEEGLPKGALWESCAIMQYLCNKHGLDRLYPTEPGERAMVDSAMFYLIGTLYPLLRARRTRRSGSRSTRARSRTSDARDELKAQARKDAEAALAGPLERVPHDFFLDEKNDHRRRPAPRSRRSAWPRRSSSWARGATTSRPGNTSTSRDDGVGARR